MASFRFEVDGMAELFQKLKEAEDKSLGIAAWGLYEGAGVVADAVSREMRGIATEPFKYAKNGKKRKPSPEEKAALISAGASGVAKFRKRLGVVETSVGFNRAGFANVNFNHMSSKGRTNYKAKEFKGHESMTTSTLKFAGVYERGLQNQKPIGVIANAINSGTSFMQKQPFMRKAFSKSKTAAVAAIEDGIRARLKELDLD